MQRDGKVTFFTGEPLKEKLLDLFSSVVSRCFYSGCCEGLITAATGQVCQGGVELTGGGPGGAVLLEGSMCCHDTFPLNDYFPYFFFLEPFLKLYSKGLQVYALQ